MNEIDMAVNIIFMAILAMATGSDVLILGPTRALEDKIPPNDKVHCRYSKAYSMLQVRCHNPMMEEIPPDLNTNIQILDASSSRIRELRNDTLSSYTNLAYVYLRDNFILNIEESAFAQLKYLEVLDLTKNGFNYVPRSLFELSYLRKLYLGMNNLDDSVLRISSISAPLNFLQLYRNKLTRLPEMEHAPYLQHLNVSENMIAQITTVDVARFCGLQMLDASKNPLQIKTNTCGCVSLKAWLETHEIEFKPKFHCTEYAINNCENNTFSNETMTNYENCIQVITSKEEEDRARYMWVLVAVAVSCFLVCVFIALCCVHKRNQKKRMLLKKEQQRINANNSNTQLLYSNLKAGNNA